MSATFKLGTFEFLSMSMGPLGPRSQISMQARAGTDEFQFFDNGELATPFESISRVDCSSKESASELLREYEKSVGTVVSLKWAGQEITEYQYMILDVDLLPGGMHVLLLGVGGVQSDNGSKAMLTVKWNLVAVFPE